MSSLKDMIGTRNALVSDLRNYVRSKLHIWKTLPYWALEADGRTGHGDDAARMYGPQRIMSVFEEGGYHRLAIKLDTGEIVALIPWGNPSYRDASDQEIAQLLPDLESLDAEKILKSYKKAAKQPTGSYYNAAEKARWREDTRREYNIEIPADA